LPLDVKGTEEAVVAELEIRGKWRQIGLEELEIGVPLVNRGKRNRGNNREEGVKENLRGQGVSAVAPHKSLTSRRSIVQGSSIKIGKSAGITKQLFTKSGIIVDAGRGKKNGVDDLMVSFAQSLAKKGLG